MGRRILSAAAFRKQRQALALVGAGMANRTLSLAKRGTWVSQCGILAYADKRGTSLPVVHGYTHYTRSE